MTDENLPLYSEPVIITHNVTLESITRENITTYWPTTEGGANQCLTNDGNGNLYWAPLGPGGNVSTDYAFIGNNYVTVTDITDRVTNIKQTLVSIDDNDNVSNVNTMSSNYVVANNNVSVLNANPLQLFDAINDNSIDISAPNILTNSYSLVMPSASPNILQSLRTSLSSAQQYEWFSPYSSSLPVISKTIYVANGGSDVTGTGSLDQPFSSISRAIDLANTLASINNPITINVQPGIYIENNTVGALSVTSLGITISGVQSTAVIIQPLVLSQPLFSFIVSVQVSNITIRCVGVSTNSAVNITGINNNTSFNTVQIIGFSNGIYCSTSSGQSLFRNILVRACSVGIYVNNSLVILQSPIIQGSLTAIANTGIYTTGPLGKLLIMSGLISKCSIGMIFTNQSVGGISAISSVNNSNDLTVNTGSVVFASGVQYTEGSLLNDITISVSGVSSVVELQGCNIDGYDYTNNVSSGIGVIAISGATVLINNSQLQRFSTAVTVGQSTDLINTVVNISNDIFTNNVMDIVQNNTTTLNVTSSSLTLSKVSISSSTNVLLSFNDLATGAALVGSLSNNAVVITQPLISTSNNPVFQYMPNVYSTGSFVDYSNNPLTHTVVSTDVSGCSLITQNRTKTVNLRLASDTNSSFGTTSALRGWDIAKNSNTNAQLDFSFYNTDTSNLAPISKYTFVEFDGVVNSATFAPNAKIILQNTSQQSINLYTNTVGALQTDNSVYIGNSLTVTGLTPMRAIYTGANGLLTSSTVSNVELSYLSNATGNIQNQINSLLPISGGTLTGSLTLPNGLLSNPSLTFTSSNTSGLSYNNGVVIGINSIASAIFSSSGLTLPLLSSGVLHSNVNGFISSSLIIGTDISPTANIQNSSLATLTTSNLVANSATTAVSSNIANSIVSRDATGNFSAGTITASLIGNVQGVASGCLPLTGGTLIGTLTLPIGTTNTLSLSFANNLTTGLYESNGIIGIVNNGSNSILALANNTIQLPTYGIGVLHSNAVGLISSSLITNSDITVGSILDSSLATITTIGKVANTATTATSSNVSNSIVLRDVSGNFSAGTITATVIGAASGNLLLTGGILTGALTLPDISLALTFHNYPTSGISFVTDVMSFVIDNNPITTINSTGLTINTLSTGVLHSNVSGVISSSLVSLSNEVTGILSNSNTTATTTSIANTLVSRDANGGFSAGMITATLNGVASGCLPLTGGALNGVLTLSGGNLLGPQLLFNNGGGSYNGLYSVNNLMSIYINGISSGDFTSTGLNIQNINTNALTISSLTNGVLKCVGSSVISGLINVSDLASGFALPNSNLATASSYSSPNYLVVRDGSGNFSTNMITILGTTTLSNDVATKSYVDFTVSTGFTAKTPVIVVSVSNVVINGLPVVDGVTLTSGQRILLINQSNKIQNGIWLVNSGAWTRPSDFASGTIATSAYILVQYGNIYKGSSWVCSTPTGVINTDPLEFIQFSLAINVVGNNVGTGTGLIYQGSTGDTLNFKTLLNGSNVSIVNDANEVQISTISTNLNTPNVIVSRDALGNFSANVITSSLNGVASGNLPLTGGVLTGTLTLPSYNYLNSSLQFQSSVFAGIACNSINGNISFVIGSSPVEVGLFNANGLVLPTVSSGVAHINSSNQLVTSNILLSSEVTGILSNANTTANSMNVANSIVSRDNSGNFTAGTITASLIGNVQGISSGNLPLSGGTLTDVLTLPGGSAASPSLIFTSAPSTGLFAVNDSLSIVTNYIERLNINLAGVVKLPSYSTGILHSDVNGVISSSLIVGSDVASNANIQNSSLATLTASGLVANSSTTATSSNIANSIVSRDATGNFSAGTITASLIGNVQGIASGCLPLSGGTLTGSLILPIGSVSNPSLSFTSSVNTGLSCAMNNVISVDVSSVEVASFSSTGLTLLGGTNTPSLSFSNSLNSGFASTLANNINCIINGVEIFKVNNVGVKIENGILTNSNGSISAPSIVFSNSSTSGFASNAVDNINCVISGVEIFKISNAGITYSTLTTQGVLINSSTGLITSTTILPNSYTTATSSNIVNSIVLRDGSGNFTAGTITASLTGIASGNLPLSGGTLTGVLTLPNGSIANPSLVFSSYNTTGISCVSGNVNISIDGVSAVQISSSSTTINSLSTGVVHSTAGVLSTSLVSLSSEVTGILSNDNTTATNSNIANSIVSRDSSGNFTAGTITASLIGIASGNLPLSGGTLTGVLTLPGGSAANPSLIFTSSPSTGLFAVNDSLSIVTNYIERLNISSLGVVKLPYYSTGILHSDVNGVISSSLIVGSDVASNANIQNSSLATLTASGLVANSSTTATSSNIANSIVLRDSLGNFTAGTITASLIGNVQGISSGCLPLSGGTLTGTLTLPIGSFSNPSLSFTSSVNTGLSCAVNNVISVDVSSVEVATFSSVGLTLPLLTAAILYTNNNGIVSRLTTGSGLVLTNGILSNSGVLSILGTGNQVYQNNVNGVVTLSLPQNIDIGASVTFGSITLPSLINSLLYTNGSGIITSVDIGSGLTFSNGILTAIGSVSSITGTTNQIIVTDNGGGNLVLSTPQSIGQTSSVTFAGLTLTQLTNTLLYANASHVVSAVTTGLGLTFSAGVLTNSGILSITGTANQVNVNNVAGAVTLSTVQDIGLTSSPTFAGLTLSGLGAGLLRSSSGGVGLVTIGTGLSYNTTTNTLSNSGVLSITGTINQIYTTSSTGVITLSLNQDIATTSSPTFAGLTLTSLTNTLLYANNSKVITAVTTGLGLTFNAGLLTNSGILSITGTANQINVNNVAGAVTLSTVQDINTTSNVQFRSLLNSSQGGNNIIIGTNALVNASASDCVAIGTNALYNCSTYQNTSVGINSGYNITSGGNNSLVGYNAGYNLSNGSNNSFFGYNTGANLIYGNNCNYIGSGSNSSSAINVDYETVIGTGIGHGSNTATIFGSNGCYFDGKIIAKYIDNSTVGYSNQIFGNDALSSTTSFGNVSIGSDSLSLGTNVYRNVAIGYQSGRDLTTGMFNSFIGARTGWNLETGNNCCYVGSNSFASAINVDYETVIGSGTGYGSNTMAFYASNGFYFNDTINVYGVNIIGLSDKLLYTDANYAISPVTIGSGLTFSAGVLTATGGGGGGITSVVGTANQINANNVAGVVTLSTPQDIGLTSTPTFASLLNSTWSTANMILGTNTFNNLATGTGNVLIGNAVSSIATTLSNSIIIGNSAGILTTTAQNLLLLGAYSKLANNTDVNSIVVGYGATGIGSNTAVYGNTGITNHYFTNGIISMDGLQLNNISPNTGILYATSGLVSALTTTNLSLALSGLSLNLNTVTVQSMRFNNIYSGILKVTDGTVAQAVVGVDYQGPIITSGNLSISNNTITLTNNPTFTTLNVTGIADGMLKITSGVISLAIPYIDYQPIIVQGSNVVLSGNTISVTSIPTFANINSSSIGTFNTLIGTLSGANLQNITTGNNLFGYQAGKSVTTGSYNVAIGYQAMGGTGTLTGGTGFNTAIGYQSLYSTTGSCTNNIGIGAYSGQFITTSNSNVSIGFQANRGLVTGTGNNVALGYNAGFNVTNSTGSYCTYIGANANPSSITVTGELVISNSPSAITGKGSNTAFLNHSGGLYVTGNIIPNCNTTNNCYIGNAATASTGSVVNEGVINLTGATTTGRGTNTMLIAATAGLYAYSPVIAQFTFINSNPQIAVNAGYLPYYSYGISGAGSVPYINRGITITTNLNSTIGGYWQFTQLGIYKITVSMKQYTQTTGKTTFIGRTATLGATSGITNLGATPWTTYNNIDYIGWTITTLITVPNLTDFYFISEYVGIAVNSWMNNIASVLIEYVSVA